MGTEHMEELTPDACWQLLAQHEYGRLAYVLDGEVNIVPINHAVVDGQIAFETGQGSKLLGIDEQVTVAYEVDDITAEQGTSVVVRGFVVSLEGDEAKAAEQDVHPWIGTAKIETMAIVPSTVTGRRYTFPRD
ncbi:Pyridoxamine 5'-phosphate oxidase [Raineyella antarctica]|uniref:Pyridoxamine 5'-phosphate oxidase n=1 Tax=Raineyella antarctica TaxID=1577474 RepID=A0A1G6GXZ2_9ACTN|nr:pyridoxamine 5'-phosphate oxidase family protein [Raineyella antarctica]SDB86016.1 Pyridoxamine 5'-phosphate oxidase [Raineyella antarctica]